MPIEMLSIRSGEYKKDKNNMEMHFMILHKWFHKNHMELEPGTCH